MSKFLRYKPELNREEIAACARGFKAYAKGGVLDPNDMVEGLKLLKFDESDPVIFDIISEFASKNKGTVSLDDFIDGLNEILQERESETCTKRVFDLFIDDPSGKQNVVDFDVLKKVVQEVGDSETDEQIKKLIENGAANQKDIAYDEFHAIMTRNVSL